MGTVYKVSNSECVQVYNVLLLNVKNSWGVKSSFVGLIIILNRILCFGSQFCFLLKVGKHLIWLTLLERTILGQLAIFLIYEGMVYNYSTPTPIKFQGSVISFYGS